MIDTQIPDKQSIVLGGGCFWCLEASFQIIRGVLSVTPGYAGGSVEDARYEKVAGKDTGHAEVVRLVYDPQQVSLKTLLAIFFTIHDPTTKDRQGYDIGPEYRSVIFYSDTEQEAIARNAIKDAQRYWDQPIVTELQPLEAFYEAEPEHHNFFRNNPDVGYCTIIINPKLEKLRKLYRSYIQT